MIKLRDYQTECVDAINALERGSALVSMATGLGKTVVFSHIKRHGRVLIISHREELVHQPLKYYDCTTGVEQGAESSHGEEVISASVQSLIKRLDKFAPDYFDIIITDEAHHAAAPSYKTIYSHFKPRVHIGFTATPNRGDKVRLDDVFEKIIFSRDLKWGIEHEWLTDIKCLRAEVEFDVRNVKRRLGDFVTGELDKAVNTQNANGQVAEIYKKYARGQTLIFASSVSHAENIASLIPGAVAVSQKTKNRQELLNAFTSRKINCLVNCMIFTEGTDLPLIETVIIARPTQSASLYAQMVGRGLRKAEGKKYLTLIDCVGVSGDLEICTAPSLMGLDLKNIPEYRKNMLSGGMITQMSGLIDEATDCPEVWITNVKEVRLFAEKQGVKTRKVNWSKRPNGDLVYQFACGDRIGIKAIDELGKTCVMQYYFSERMQKFIYKETPCDNLQSALDMSYDIFSSRYTDERKLWDLTSSSAWQYEKASEKQIEFINAKLSYEDKKHIDLTKLTKGEAAEILNMLQIRNLRPSDLYRMHQKTATDKQNREAENEVFKKLKIRRLLTGKYKGKYYAVRHVTDLILTDSWDIASETIAELNKNNEKQCRYKSFLTIKQAEDFLRGNN